MVVIIIICACFSPPSAASRTLSSCKRRSCCIAALFLSFRRGFFLTRDLRIDLHSYEGKSLASLPHDPARLISVDGGKGTVAGRIAQKQSCVALSPERGREGAAVPSGGGQLCDNGCRYASLNDDSCQERLNEVLDRLERLDIRADVATYASLLRRCGNAEALCDGKRVHAHIMRAGYYQDRFLGNLLVQMYGKCGCPDDARGVFDKIRGRNMFSWNIMIAAYSQTGQGRKALRLFRQMLLKGVAPDKITFISILDVCANLTALADGEEIHTRVADSGFETDVVVGTALVNMYGKCGSLRDAKKAFDKMPQRDVVSWTAMIAAYAQNGHCKAALKLYRQMQLKGVEPDKITYISILDACAGLAALAEGKQSHASIISKGFEIDAVVGNALVNMYGKCGSLDVARIIFDKMLQPNVISWNIVISAYSQNGQGKEALELFRQMRAQGVQPDKITFINILSGCSHAGLLEDGWCYFNSMNKDYSLSPTVEHFVCMIDLLGRAGQLAKAENLINKMAFGPFVATWMSLLGACRIHGDVELGAYVAERIFELNPKNASPLVLLSNIYAMAGKWDDAAKVRMIMKDRGVQKTTGCSCIEIKKRVYKFAVGHTSHPRKEEIYAELWRLTKQMEEAGYMPDTKAVLRHSNEVNQKRMLRYHSEKLAIAFGLISTLPGTSLHITKNLRVCCDCHAATKFISKLVGRQIIVRDANRFHHFENGVCSCGDYW